MGRGEFLYNLVLFLHITAAIVGFGSSFVWPALASRARAMPPDQGYALTHTAYLLGKPLTTYPIVAAGVLGIVLTGMAQAEDYSGIKFSQLWISLAFLFFIGGVCLSVFLHSPNLKKIDELQARLVSGEAQPGPNGPPPEVRELEDRGKQAAIYGGLLHLLFVALMIVMIWKPGGPAF